MHRPITLLGRFLANRGGATMLEYGFIVALIGMGSVVLLNAFGTDIVSIFTDVTTNLQ